MAGKNKVHKVASLHEKTVQQVAEDRKKLHKKEKPPKAATRAGLNGQVTTLVPNPGLWAWAVSQADGDPNRVRVVEHPKAVDGVAIIIYNKPLEEAMSLAKVQQVKKARKPQGKCEVCGVELGVGDPYIHFAVGFRGFTHRRCTKPECFPRPSERESSAVSTVYAAQESADFTSCHTLDDIMSIVSDVAASMREVAEEYEQSEMFEVNADLQERADILNSSADELEAWEPEEAEPDENDWDPDEDEEGRSFEEAYADWLSNTIEEAQGAIDDAELP